MKSWIYEIYVLLMSIFDNNYNCANQEENRKKIESHNIYTDIYIPVLALIERQKADLELLDLRICRIADTLESMVDSCLGDVMQVAIGDAVCKFCSDRRAVTMQGRVSLYLSDIRWMLDDCWEYGWETAVRVYAVEKNINIDTRSGMRSAEWELFKNVVSVVDNYIDAGFDAQLDVIDDNFCRYVHAIRTQLERIAYPNN